MQYLSIKCPHCGKYIEVNRSTGWNDIERYIGDPHDICIFCMKPHSTGRKYWKDMHAVEKAIIYGRIIFGALIGGLVIGMFPLLAFIFLDKQFDWIQSNEGHRNAIFSCLLLGILYSTWAHFLELKNLKKLP